jgi:hypothetical protein
MSPDCSGPWHWDIVAEIDMLASDQGGRLGPTPEGKFNCIMQMDEWNFDVRLDLADVGSLVPGQQLRVPIKFLDPVSTKLYCSVGRKFSLRELRKIGSSTIEVVDLRI